MASVIDLLKSHRSIRKFTDEKIPPDLLQALFEAGQAAATSSFLQGSTIVRVTDPANRSKLAELAGNQKYVEIAKNIQVEMVSTDWKPVIELVFKGKKPLEKENINVDEFIAVKGIKAIGNQLSRKEVKEINIMESIPYIPEKKELNEIEVVQENVQDEGNNEDDSGSQASFDF